MRRTLLLFLCLYLAVPLGAARQPLRARHGMVIAMEATAADVGVAVLQQGGNAVDAAVAVGFAMAVTHPFAGNLGGGGYMLIRMADGRATFIDFRERAPEKASRNMYLDAGGELTRDSLEGWRSSGVPGTVRGFELAVSKYGRRKWAENIAPAVELASKGFPISYAIAEGLKGAKDLAKSPESKRIFQKNGAFYDVGERLTQPELAQTLERILKNGPNEFYEGETAKRFAEEMAKNGGLITLADLKSYKAIERTPLTGTYHGYTIITAPPSSSGGIALLEMLGILDGTGYEKGGAGSASAIHYGAEAMRRAYADRNSYVGDPDFVKVPIDGLLDPAYHARLRASIDPERATASDTVRPGKPVGSESMETTHYSVVDSEGNAVAVTYTLNEWFGAKVMPANTGIVMNDEMDDFTSKVGAPNLYGLVQGEANAIAPGKRPLSSMSPTIVSRDGKPVLVIGTPGGSRIITVVLQVILNTVDYGMNLQEAIDAPRIHQQWLPETTFVEPFALSPDTRRMLTDMGHQITETSPWSHAAGIMAGAPWLGGASRDGNRYYGAIDPRRNTGLALGY